jgi:hypothetical protein
MRVRRVFAVSEQIDLNKNLKGISVTAVPIIYKRDRHIVDERLLVDVCEKRLIGGSLFNIRYTPFRLWWIEATTGILRERVKSTGTASFTDARTGFDDFVLSTGFNLFPHKDIQLVFYTLGGIPTRTKVTLLEKQGTLVGTRFFGLGAGTEFSYAFINSLKRSFLGLIQVRFLHFFNRKFFPILPCDATIQPGNVTDVLLTLQYREKKNVIETGYNATLFTNQAVHLKTETIKDPHILRNSWYLTYTRLSRSVPLLQVPGAIGTGLNIGRAQRFDTKIVSLWIYMAILF